MFDIGWGELLLIGIVALIAIGPKELPTVLRTVGQWMGKLRRMAAEFQAQFHEAIREAEMSDLKKQVDDVASQAQSYTHFDPVGDIRREFEGAQRQIDHAIAAAPSASQSISTKDDRPPAPSTSDAQPAHPTAESASTANVPAEITDTIGSPSTRDAEAKPA